MLVIFVWVVMIQVDIGATHLFHLNPHHYFFYFFSFLNCSTIYYFGGFLGPKLLEPFWGPKRQFWDKAFQENMSWRLDIFYPKCSHHIDIFNEVSCASNKDRMPKLRPEEIDVPIYPNRAHSLVCHLLGLGFCIFMDFHWF